MLRIDNIADILISVGSILALFEFLPPLKREKLDTYLNDKLTWKYLCALFIIVTVTYIGLRFFPYFTPYIPLIIFAALSISSKYLNPDHHSASGVGCVIGVVTIVICIPIIYLTEEQRLELFFTTLAYFIIVIIFSVITENKLESYPFFALSGFLLLGLPSLASYKLGNTFIDTLLYPYFVLGDFLKQEGGFVYYLIPHIENGDYADIYLKQIERLPNPEDKVLLFKILTWYKSTAGGYFLFFGVLFQLSFVYFAFKLANFIIAAICVPLMRTSDLLKRKFGIEQRRVPIIGAMFILIGSLLKIIVKAFSL